MKATVTIENAKQIITRAIECNKRVSLCVGKCDKCKWEYHDRELFPAIKTLMKELENSQSNVVSRDLYNLCYEENLELKKEISGMREELDEYRKQKRE